MNRCNVVFIFLFMASLLFMSGGCTKDNKKSASITIQFDQSIVGTNKTHLKNNSSYDGDEPDWGLVDPTSLSDINCYGIFVHGEELEMSNSSCSKFDGSSFKFGPRAGFYKLNQSAGIEVLAGTKRSIYLLGMSSGDGSCESTFAINSDINSSNYSNPFILGSVKMDLEPGPNVINLALQNTFTDSNKIKDCDFFNGDEHNINSPLEVNLAHNFTFPNTVVGGSSTSVFTLTNTSTDITVTNIHISGFDTGFSYAGGSFPGSSSGGNCTATLLPQQTCQLGIEFTPSSAVVISSDIEINYTFGSQAASIEKSINGGGLTPAVLDIASHSPPYDFGNVTQGSVRSEVFTITNNGGAVATGITGAGLAAPFNYTGGVFPGGGSCTSSIASGVSCTFIVEYSPSGLGFVQDTVEISYNDGVSVSSLNFIAQGTSVTPAQLSISESPVYTFPSAGIGVSKTKIFTVTNTGDSAASSLNEINLSAPFSFNGGGFPGVGGTCPMSPATLGPAQSCTIDVKANSGSAGTFNDDIHLEYFNGVIMDLLQLNVDFTVSI